MKYHSPLYLHNHSINWSNFYGKFKSKIQLSRKSKRQAGKDVDKEVVTKRPAKAAAPNHQSLAGFEKKLEATIQAKPVGKYKPRRQSKGLARLDTPCLIAEPQD
jgi:hypothetical protein